MPSSSLCRFTIHHIKEPFISDIGNLLHILNIFDVRFKDKNIIQKYLNVLNKVINNVRLPANNGFTASDMFKIECKTGFKNIKMTLGDNIKKDFLNGELDPLTFISQLESSDSIPESIKKSLKDQLLEISKESNGTRKA